MKVMADFVERIRQVDAFFPIITAMLLLMYLPSGEAYGAAGDLIWQDVFNLSAGGNQARSVAASGNSIFVGGVGEQSNNQAAWVFRAYEAETGQLLWDDVFNPGGGNTTVFDVAAEGNRVFAAGGGDDQTGSGVWIVRAYNQASGDLLWEDLLENDGRDAEARAVSTSTNRVFVGGSAENNSGRSEWLVRAYDSSTGDLIWQDRFGVEDKDEGARAITVAGDRLYVSGGAANILTAGDWLVRAYDAEAGEVLWEDQLGASGGNFVSLSITAQDGGVFASGVGTILNNSDWIVRAYDAGSGDEVWEDRFDIGLGIGATGITANQFGVFATGDIASMTEGNAMIVKSYNPANGDVRWEDRVNFDQGGGSGGKSISAEGDMVYAAGSGSVDSNFAEEWILKAYNGESGDVLWEDLFSLGEDANIPFATAVQEKRVYAVGSALDNINNSIDFAWIVRAYEAGGGGGGGCSVSAVGSENAMPLFLVLPAIILVMRLRRRHSA